MKQVLRRKGTTEEHESFVGALAEITVDTSKKTVVVHDGVTPGGFPAAREDHTHDLAPIGHNHDSLYSNINHHHDTEYSLLTHNHDNLYASDTHTHFGEYARINHDHANFYAEDTHDHDLVYSPIVHDHDADYEPFRTTIAKKDAIQEWPERQIFHDVHFRYGYTKKVFHAGSRSVTFTVHLSQASIFHVVIDSNPAGSPDLSFIFNPSLESGLSFRLVLQQDDVGGNTVAFPSSVKFPNGDILPPMSTDANMCSILDFYCDGVSWYGAYTQLDFLIL